MTLTVTSDDLAFIPNLSRILTTFFYKKDSVSIAFTVLANSDGRLRLSITQATFCGLGLFGLVKTKSRAIILGLLAGYSEVSASVDFTGDILIALPKGMKCDYCYFNEKLELTLELTL